MSKKLVFLSVLIFILTLCGCEYLPGTSAGRIIPPPVKAHPFEGKWEVLDVLSPENSVIDETESWAGSFVQFAGDALVFGNRLWDSPSYSIKRVVAEVYLESKDVTAVFPATSTETADVVTIYASNKYLGEFVTFDETTMVFLIENHQLLLNKISDRADSMLRETYREAISEGPESGDAYSGVLIGLKSKSLYGDYVYRTLWIAASRDHVRPALESNNIFFPRMSGFWECFTALDYDGITRGNTLTARSAFTRSAETQRNQEEDGAETRPDPAHVTINYIGNDYASVERTSEGESRLLMLPVEYLSSTEGVKAADLLGANGSISYENARALTVLALLDENTDLLISDDRGESYGLLREKGHWKLIGRANYLDNDVFEYSDFDLRVIPPNNLVFYDTLALNWNRIKDRVPDAIDAFTSPDKSIAIVKTRNKLTVYTIDTEQLSEVSLSEIEISEGETIVMAEWATALYVDAWERAFLSYGARRQ